MHDRPGQARMTEVRARYENSFTIENSLSRQIWIENGHERKSYAATEFFYVAIEGRGSKELYVAIGFFSCRDREMCMLWKLGHNTKILGRDRIHSW